MLLGCAEVKGEPFSELSYKYLYIYIYTHTTTDFYLLYLLFYIADEMVLEAHDQSQLSLHHSNRLVTQFIDDTGELA